MERRKVVLVDDERPALEILKTLVGKRLDLEIALETTRFQEAYDYLDEHDIDLLVVDLDLRVESGYTLMGAVEPPTQIIVCTASDNEGSESLLAGAIDYVVKMVQEDRFNFAIDRALRQLELLEREREMRTYPSTIAVLPEEGNAYVNVRVAELVYARSEGKCARLFLTHGREMLASMLLRDLQVRLNPADFIRNQRGFIVRREAVSEYLPGAQFGTKHWWVELHEDAVSIWENDREKGMLPVGEKYRYRVEKTLGVR
ncbi:LytR/AlgR family response regulator transcription factor [Parapedobacter tibetensis]|uniref:LytR/AlgR family response regulator transcription factor n=1 Tax=Parapedobacter tibetensis TaxID=2972951 RepID=UPI00214D3799|nr:LytTR family DNA-binding domain-containing protein [Parapedobacter tibetensis]